MKHVLTGILSTAAIYGLLAATPVAAQVAGNPGDMHTPTPYTSDYWARTHAYDYGSYRNEPGFAGPFADLGDEPVGSFNDDLAFPAILIFREERSPTQNRVYHFSRSVTYPSGFLQKGHFRLLLSPVPGLH